MNVHILSFPLFQHCALALYNLIFVTVGDKTLSFDLYIAESKSFHNALCLSRAHDVTLVEFNPCKINEFKITGLCSLLFSFNLPITFLINIVNIVNKSSKLFQKY